MVRISAWIENADRPGILGSLAVHFSLRALVAEPQGPVFRGLRRLPRPYATYDACAKQTCLLSWPCVWIARLCVAHPSSPRAGLTNLLARRRPERNAGRSSGIRLRLRDSLRTEIPWDKRGWPTSSLGPVIARA